MVRYRSKKALYEVISENRLKPRLDKTLEKVHPDKAEEDKPIQADSDTQPTEAPAWPRKPRIAQLNAGRFEVSIPYQLAIALFLGLILLILVVFRLGQFIPLSSEHPAQEDTGQTTAGLSQPRDTIERTPSEQPISAERTIPAELQGDHRIVIKQYSTDRDLKPVQEHFAARGIETIIEKRGSNYFLLSKNTYENPQKLGTNGYQARMRIIKAGADYKAPAGYETFAPNLFNDAYGERIR